MQRFFRITDTKHVHDVGTKLDSSMDGDASPIPLSDARGDSRPLNDASMNNPGPIHFEQILCDVREVARTNR